MTPQEQVALSYRYLAPRVFRLDCGLYALVDMAGDAPPAILSGEALLIAIPTLGELDSSVAPVPVPVPKPTSKPPRPSLNDVLGML